MSTLYAAAPDVNESDRELFYKHMGQTEQVSKGTYQRPLAMETLSQIGPVLLNADQRTSK